MQADLDQMHAEQAAVAQQEAIDRAVAEGLAAQQPAAPAGDAMAELQKLAAMKQQGLLSDEEFTAMKSKLLGL